MKVLVLAFLFFLGLILIALSFFKAEPNIDWPASLSFVAWGVSCLLIAAIWVYWDHSRQGLTADETLAQPFSETDTRSRFGLACCETLTALTWGPIAHFGHYSTVSEYDEMFNKIRDRYYLFFSGRYLASYILLRGRKVKPSSLDKHSA